MALNSTNLNDNFASRLRFWRVRQNFTQAEAARLLKIDRSYLSQVERGRPPGNALRLRFLLIEKSPAVNAPVNIGAAHGLRNLPVLTWTQAGAAIDFSEIPREWDEVVPSDVPDEKAFAVKLQGDSMEPKFSDGDIAILLPNLAPGNGEIVVANLKDEGVLCKIMHVQLDRNLIKLSSYNPAYPPMERLRHQFHWIFAVASILKPLRRR